LVLHPVTTLHVIAKKQILLDKLSLLRRCVCVCVCVLVFVVYTTISGHVDGDETKHAPVCTGTKVSREYHITAGPSHD
jgi:hypothetical protein